MTSDTSKKTLLEQSLTLPHFSRPKSQIKPLISISHLRQDLSEEKLKKKLALHSTTGEYFTLAPQNSSVPLSSSAKNSVKVLRNQHCLSKLHYQESGNGPDFNKNFFYSKLKYLPRLSTLQMRFFGGSRDILKPRIPLLANLPLYKRLAHLDLNFVSFNLSDIKLLHVLFQGVQRLKPTLKSLSILVFSCSYMSDQDLQVLSLYVGKLTQLEAFELTFSVSAGFSDKELLRLTAALSKLKLLRKLNLNFGDCLVVNTIPNFFGALQQLQNLSDLSLNFARWGPNQKNNTTTELIAAGLMLIKTFPIQKLALHLSTLHHSSEDLSLWRILPQFVLLKSLDLYFTQSDSATPLTDQDLVNILACLKEIPNLSSLSLSFSNLKKLLTIIRNVGEALRFLPGLSELKLIFSRLDCSDKDMMDLWSGIECLSSLKSLDISLDSITQTTMKGMSTLTDALKKMVQLRSLTLILKNNKFITKEGFSHFCSSIKSLRNLAHLSIDFGLSLQLNRERAEELAEALKSFDCLEVVRLNFFGFSRVANGQDVFLCLFEVLRSKKTIQDVNLTLEVDPWDLTHPELLRFQQRKNFSLI